MLKNNQSIGIFALFFVSACTQPPAQIEMKGQQSFSRGSQSSYSSPSSSYSSSGSSYGSSSSYSDSSYSAPVSQATEQNASVSSIGISDLAPPTESPKPLIKPAPAHSDSDSNVIGKQKTTVNPWTNRPRSANEPKDLEVKQKAMVAKTEEKVKPEKVEETAQVEHKTEPAKTKNSAELKWPVASKRVLSSFGSKGEGKANDGINIAASNGDPVWAAADGQVVYVSNEMRGFGNMVFIKHSGSRTTSYAHLSHVNVDKYDRVKKGDVIGYVGSTGNVKTPQLFFSLHKGKEAIDPQKYINSEMAGL